MKCGLGYISTCSECGCLFHAFEDECLCPTCKIGGDDIDF